jgi:hypothetical protein
MKNTELIWRCRYVVATELIQTSAGQRNILMQEHASLALDSLLGDQQHALPQRFNSFSTKPFTTEGIGYNFAIRMQIAARIV